MMFIHDTHLPQLLKPEDYVSAEQFEKETERLFLPAWHCIGALCDLPQEHSYRTMTLFGHPLLIWRAEGGVHVYLNVCSHRHSQLRCGPCGVMETLKCQYHGWEYNTDGDTQKIPDAKSFRPMKKGELGLKKFRAETIGQLIFVTLNDAAPSLREYLGPCYQDCMELFPRDAVPVLSAVRHNRCNWKVALENAMEGYHLEEVHPKTFRVVPDEALCRHELREDSSVLWVDAEPAQSHLYRLGLLALKLAGISAELNHYHYHRYPNFIASRLGFFSWYESTIATSPTDSDDHYVFFYIGQPRDTWRSRAVARAARMWGQRWFRNVLSEDEAILPSVQKGLEAPEHPGTGLVSMREERIFNFQRYVQKNTANGVHTSSPNLWETSPT
jgi:phenylpropionate dioxygenase-like ring-hydroxylating dioxygenase large terminal subunit